MIVHFSASLRSLNQDIEMYRKILEIVRANGNIIARDWVETSWLYEKDDSPNKPERDWSTLASGGEASIENADLVIVEASGSSSFGAGFEAAMAIQRKKPTLILLRKEMVRKSYALGLSRELVTVKQYVDETLEKIVSDFLKENAVTTKDLRFNFVIDRRIYNHLRTKSFQTGKTKAEVLRDLLLKDLEGTRG